MGLPGQSIVVVGNDGALNSRISVQHRNSTDLIGTATMRTVAAEHRYTAMGIGAALMG
jgi:hypothetical protein